ncbi:hypothetical protein FSP39_019484 [Pinctada imbricata]|uniref:Uncharacterized protein n=1 Tax=Pinctada imbricata TaxID=66713 RepID=A0AA88YAL8_PINIB|nr:hypothetical protein FSP39_019484 [Pinctada imbricata]
MEMNNSELPDDIEISESHDYQSDSKMNEDNIFTELPDALIITNIHEQVFSDPSSKATFEAVFMDFDETVTFQYLKNFRRARVNFSLPENAVRAKIHLHETEVCNKIIKCYIAQPKFQSQEGETHLQPPPPEKQFLISPPASPPVGWEPVREGEPVINYDLLSALAKLAPGKVILSNLGEVHELHPSSDKHPAIVVHLCEDNPAQSDGPRTQPVRTRCPERSS